MRNGLFAIKAYSIAILTMAAGVAMSLHFSDWSWFSRSGSLVVVNGIILTSHQIIEHMHNLGRYQRQGETPCSRDWAHAERHTFLHDDHELRWMSEKCGLYLLVVGTLIWGFGDLAAMIGR